MDAYDTLAEQVGAFGEVVGRNVANFSRQSASRRRVDVHAAVGERP